MKDTIAKFSSERLESEIANLYFQASKEAPGVTLKETGLLGMLWREFDERFAAGTIDRDSDYTEDRWDD